MQSSTNLEDITKHPLYKTYETFFKSYTVRQPIGGVDNNSAVSVLAQIAILFLSRPHLECVMKELEKDLTSALEKTNKSIKTPAKAEQHVNVHGLKWPYPSPEIMQEVRQQKLDGILNEVLLKKEQSYGFNLNPPPNKKPVKKFSGFVNAKEAEDHLKNYNLFDEDTIYPGLLSHGKRTHRIQFRMIMHALELGLIKLPANMEPKNPNDRMKIIMDLLMFKTANNSALWNDLIDNPMFSRPIIIQNTDLWLAPIFKQHVGEKIKKLTEDEKFIYGSDPFYFNNELLNNRSNPNLQACIWNSFFKDLDKSHQLEKRIGLTKKFSEEKGRYVLSDEVTLENTFFQHIKPTQAIDSIGPINIPSRSSDLYEKGRLEEEIKFKPKEVFVEKNDKKEIFVGTNIGDGFMFFPSKEKPKENKSDLHRALQKLDMTNKAISFECLKTIFKLKLINPTDFNHYSSVKELYQHVRDYIQKGAGLKPYPLLLPDNKLALLDNNSLIKEFEELVSHIQKNKDGPELKSILEKAEQKTGYKI